jgi:hypothetical protein
MKMNDAQTMGRMGTTGLQPTGMTGAPQLPPPPPSRMMSDYDKPTSKNEWQPTAEPASHFTPTGTMHEVPGAPAAVLPPVPSVVGPSGQLPTVEPPPPPPAAVVPESSGPPPAPPPPAQTPADSGPQLDPPPVPAPPG